MPKATPAPIHKVLFTREEVSVALSVGQTMVDFLIKDRQLSVIKIGTRSLVPASELEAFVSRKLGEV